MDIQEYLRLMQNIPPSSLMSPNNVMPADTPTPLDSTQLPSVAMPPQQGEIGSGMSFMNTPGQGMQSPEMQPDAMVPQQPQIDAGGLPIDNSQQMDAGGMTSQATQAFQPPTQPQDIKDSYNPKTTAGPAYQDALANPPVDQPTSRMRKLAAMISGGLVAGTMDPATGIKVGQQVLDQPNAKAKKDYQERLDQLSKGAAEEDKYNTNERIRANNAATQDINQQKVDTANARAATYQQDADTKAKKETDVHETAMKKITADIDNKTKQLMIAKQNADAHSDSVQYAREYHQAEMALKNAHEDATEENMTFMQGIYEGKLEVAKKISDLKAAGGGIKETSTVVKNPDGSVASSSIRRVGPQGSNILTDPDDPKKRYDTSSWSADEIKTAKIKGYY